MPKLAAISTVLVLGAGICGEKLSEVQAPSPDADGVAVEAPAEPYIERTNRNLGELKRDIQNTHDGREAEVEGQLKAGEP